MKRNMLTAVLLVAAVVFYCMSQQAIAAWMMAGFACELAAIAIGMRTSNAPPKLQSMAQQSGSRRL